MSQRGVLFDRRSAKRIGDAVRFVEGFPRDQRGKPRRRPAGGVMQKPCDTEATPDVLNPTGDTADATEWTAGTDSPVLQITKLVRTHYADTLTDPILYGFLRTYTYHCGKLVHVSAETRFNLAETCEEA
jgi:hypothetical protein